MKTTTENKVMFKAAGKSISGGALTHAKRRGQVVGYIVETLGLFMAHNDRSNLANFAVCHSMEEAKSLF